MKLWILCSILAALLSGRCLADSCTKLASISLAETAITKVELVAAGPYTANSEFVNPPPVYDLPAHCRVVGFIHPASDSKIGFEVWLPAGGWNGRFMQVGNGGLAGSIPHADMALTLAEGAATAGTDDGHVSASGFDGVWAIGHPEKLIDFGYRAVHLTAVVGKALVKAYYGAKAKRDYFVGCSDGGRESLMEAQRYPEDFDGYVVGAPWIAISSMVGHIHEGVTLNALGPDHQLTTSQLKAISTRVIQQCDALDGVKDGILRDPRACKFDPHVMTCTSGQPSGECLTTAQADAVERIYEGPRDPANGARLAWGDNGTLGLEDRNWAPILVDATGRVSPVALAIAPIAAVLLYGDPARDVSTDLATTARELATKVRPIISPDNPDLSRARDLHRKILMFHGWADPNIKPQDSVEYFEAVEKRMGDVGDFFRFFMIPGMAHCGAGPNTGADFVGPDANSKRISQLTSASNNWQLALERWVEEGKAPEKIIATEFDLPPNALPGAPVPPGAGIKSTRPLCTYPKVAVYNGSGPITSAASFECKLP